MTALEIALAGYLAFGQLTGNSYEAITKHSGLQVIHADGAVTLRLRERGTGNPPSPRLRRTSGERVVENGDGSKTIVIRMRDEQKGSDLIATVNYHSKETWRQQTE